jgi:toxin ParE1/3/4
MGIRWTQAAIADLCSISDYLTETTPQYRRSTMRTLHRGIYSLHQFPNRGRAGTEEGTRELLFPPLPYVAVYRVEEKIVHVLRIYHAAQDR